MSLSRGRLNTIIRCSALWGSILSSLFLPQNGVSQSTASEPAHVQEAPAGGAVAPGPQEAFAQSVSPKFSIGRGDDLDVSVYGVPEMSQHVRVGTSGEVNLPLVGRIPIAGLSSEEAQAEIEKRLIDGGFVKNPHVTVYVKDYTTEEVSIVGEVNKPGSYPALATRRLYDALQEAGGLTQTASKTVSITHAGQRDNPIVLKLSDDPYKSAQANVEILPGDSIAVSKARLVYVIGEVSRPGGYVLESDQGSSESLTVMRVIALASGPLHGASLNRSKIIRRTPNGIQEVPIPLKAIMAGKAPDPPLQSEDIVYVPGSGSKAGITSVLTTVATAAIFRI